LEAVAEPSFCCLPAVRFAGFEPERAFVSVAFEASEELASAA
jgi:hypothetical protein